MRKLLRAPIALTIAGSDSGGGAGIQADLNTFTTLGVHGATVLACLTAQNPKCVTAAIAVEPKFVRAQLEAVFEELAPDAIKTGMLFNAPVIDTVREFLSAHRTPLVIDPVMVATSGARLLDPKAIASFKKLFPLATLLTPNLDEAAALLDRPLQEPEDLRQAARDLHSQYGCAILVKGGHLRGLREAIDILFDGRAEHILTAPFIKGVQTHGTGCTYSAAITAFLAKGDSLQRAVTRAKEFVTNAIQNTRQIRNSQVLGWRT